VSPSRVLSYCRVESSRGVESVESSQSSRLDYEGPDYDDSLPGTVGSVGRILHRFQRGGIGHNSTYHRLSFPYIHVLD